MEAEFIAKLVQMHGENEFLDGVFRFTASASSLFFAVSFVAAALFVWFFRKKERFEFAPAALIILPLTLLANRLIRALVGRQRPFEVIEGLVPLVSHSPGNSFPSNHAAASFAVSFFIYFINPRFGVLFFFLSFLVSVSRLYAGLHFPSDVLAGMLVAASFALLARFKRVSMSSFLRKISGVEA